MNLPDLVQLISDTYNTSSQLWSVVGLPDTDTEERRSSFFTQLATTCQEFQQSQQAYLDFVNSQIVQLQQQVSELSVQLGMRVEVVDPKSSEKKWTVLHKLQCALKTLRDEFDTRLNQALRLVNEIQIKCDAADEAYPELGNTFDCSIQNCFQNAVQILKLGPKMDQINRLQHLNEAIDKIIAPQFEQAHKLRSELLKVMNQLGRQQLIGLNENQEQIVNLTVNNQLQPKHNTFIQQVITSLQEEIANRVTEISQINEQILQLQQIQQIGMQLLTDKVEPHQLNQLLQPGSVLIRDGCVNDTYYAEVCAEKQRLSDLQENNCGIFIGLLIHKKYTLLSQINKQYERIANITVAHIIEHQREYRFESPIAKLFALMTEITTVQELLAQIQPIKSTIDTFNELQLDQNELEHIMQDKTRFTSKSRDALQKRKREESLKKNLTQNFPKIMAALIIKLENMSSKLNLNNLNLNDFDIFWNKVAGNPVQISTKDLFGVNYYEVIMEVLTKQDQQFKKRYQQFVEHFKRESSELRREIVASPVMNTMIIKTPAVNQKLNQKTKTPVQNMKVGVQNSMLKSSGTSRLVKSLVESTPVTLKKTVSKIPAMK
ncbi:Microtubule_associated protein [Hexamita inflata]|uniref:Microtubule associated protein n=1 Tax=Hexamita inflata TaxID=28002 RepID=A0AA86NAH4_9EUKA|nr:Microtubule associated protein [Hexamita inflata]